MIDGAANNQKDFWATKKKLAKNKTSEAKLQKIFLKEVLNLWSNIDNTLEIIQYDCFSECFNGRICYENKNTVKSRFYRVVGRQQKGLYNRDYH